MDPERNNLFLTGREAEILLEPQNHVGEVRGQIDRMINGLREQIYLSPGKEISLKEKEGMSEGLGDYPIVSNFGVRLEEGNLASLEIGASRFSDLPSEKPIEYYVNYEALDKLVFINENSITSIPKSSIESPNKVNRMQGGNVRKEMISPVDFSLMKNALDAVEHKKIFTPTPSFSPSK